VWQTTVDACSYLAQHRVGGKMAMPASGFIELVCAATRSLLGTAPRAVSDVRYEIPLVVSDDEESRVEVALTRTAGDTFAFQIFSKASGAGAGSSSWLACAKGNVSIELSGGAPAQPITAGN
jgi:hypothetical protein